MTDLVTLCALTLNLFARHGEWAARRAALRAGIADLQPDLVALQEAVTDEQGDTAIDVLGPDYEVVHQQSGLVGDPSHHGASVATRWPIHAVHEVDLHVTPRTDNYNCGAVITDIAAPAPFGRLLVASHGNSWAWWAERERELQALALVRRLDELLADGPAHVIVGGDFNATPDTSSMRFLTGRQSLDGLSTAYHDCWESAHGDLPGWTFDPRNPLTAIDEPDLDRGRRVDYLLLGCGDHGPALHIADCHLTLNRPVNGSLPSDHYGVTASLRPSSSASR